MTIRMVLAVGLLAAAPLTQGADKATGLDPSKYINDMDAVREAYAKNAKADFAVKFNRLAEAIEAFAEAYNLHQGRVWPAREAAALDKAWEALQSSPGWLKTTVESKDRKPAGLPGPSHR